MKKTTLEPWEHVRPYEFMSRAERIATSERENWDPDTWDAINWRWRQPLRKKIQFHPLRSTSSRRPFADI